MLNPKVMDLLKLFDGDNDSVAEFLGEITSSGMAVADMEGGILLGLTSDMLKGLLEESEANEDKRVVIYINDAVGTTEEYSN